MEKDRKIIVKKLTELIPRNICNHHISYLYSSSFSWECEEMNLIKVRCYISDLIWSKELCIDMRNSCSKLCDYDYEKMVEEKITEFVKNLKNDIIEADNKLNTENNDDKMTEEEHKMNKEIKIDPNELESKLKDETIAPQQVTWDGAIWYHTNGGVHVAITIKEENDVVWYVSSDNKGLGIYWQMPRDEWVKTYILYEGTVKPTCYPEGSFDKMVEETKESYEKVVKMLKEGEILRNKTGFHHVSIENEPIMENSKETYLKTDESKMKEFSSGAKREDKSGKGRYDLIPGDIMSEFEEFVWEAYFKNGTTTCSPTDVSKSAYFDDWTNVELYYDFMFNVVSLFFVPSIDREECEDDNGEISYEITWDGFRTGLYNMRNALAKHYEAGAVVHGVDNWKKGLPVYGSERGGCFLDSMRRHTDQALQGKDDEPHAVAALWNAFGAVWTLKHRPNSAMYQNASAVKAEEASTVDDIMESLITSLNPNQSEDK